MSMSNPERSDRAHPVHAKGGMSNKFSESFRREFKRMNRFDLEVLLTKRFAHLTPEQQVELRETYWCWMRHRDYIEELALLVKKDPDIKTLRIRGH